MAAFQRLAAHQLCDQILVVICSLEEENSTWMPNARRGSISALSGGDDFEMLQVILAVKEIGQQ